MTIDRKKTWLGLGIILLATVFTYSNHFNNGFHFDDFHSIENNAYIRNIKNLPLFFKDGSTSSILPQNQSYRPVVVATLAIDYYLGKGYDLFYFHLSTFIFFLLQGILMFFMFRSILFNSTGRAYTLMPLAAVALYLMHPANAETVNYVIARSDVQSTFFVVLAMVLYIRSSFCRKTFLYLLPAIAGALAKPSAVMFAPILFFYILLFEQKLSIGETFSVRNFKGLVNVFKKTLPAFLVCIASYYFISKMTPATWQPGGTSVFKYLITQPYVILHYFTTFFLPTQLSADSDWSLMETVADARFFTGMLFILLMIIASVYCSKKVQLRPISFGIIWFFLALIPTSSIVPLAEVMNDHRMYFPLIGLTLAVCWFLYLVLNKYTNSFQKKSTVALVSGITCVVVGVYAYGTYQRNKVWHDEESLWYDVTMKSPNNGRGAMNYGLAKMSKGEYAEAETYFLKTIDLLPQYPLGYLNMGVVKEATGDKINAELYFKQGISLNPNSADAYYLYGRFLVSQSRFNDAVTILENAVQLAPGFMQPRVLLMSAYENLSAWDKLQNLAQSTLDLLPGDAVALQYLEASKARVTKADRLQQDAASAPTAEKYLELSLQYYNSGNYEACIDAANKALQLKPDMAEAYNNIGTAYNSMKQFSKAVSPLEKALALKPNFELASNNLKVAKFNIEQLRQAINVVTSDRTAENYLTLSLAYFNNGMYEKCIEAADKALSINPKYDLAYNNKCAAYNELKNWEKAIQTGKKGLEINPNNQILKNNLQVAITAAGQK